jgi:hypothetical protein
MLLLYISLNGIMKYKLKEFGTKLPERNEEDLIQRIQ